MDNAALVQVLASVLGSTVLVSLITAYLNRKKLGAEATDIITQAATGVVNQFKEDNARLRQQADRDRQERAELRGRLDELELAERRREWELHQLREQLQVHAAFDYLAIDKLREVGIDIGEAPPLMPDWVKARRKSDWSVRD